MDKYDFCDYCGQGFGDTGFLRAVGFSETLWEGVPKPPLVRLWCGACQPNDTVDPDAHRALNIALGRGAE